MWSVNVCKLRRRKAELEARLANADVDMLMLRETWLCEAVEEVRISGFYLVGWLDRIARFGGVAIYARDSVTNIGLLVYSDTAERMWCILRTHLGVFVFGNLYRAPTQATHPYCH